MKPDEFWNSTFREINIFIQSSLCRVMDDLRNNVKLQEAVTDKIIMADAMSNKNPKIKSLIKTYKNLFQEEKAQTPEEIARRMRDIMHTEI